MSRGGAWKTGGGRAWRELRLKILERDRYRCRAHADGWCARVGRRRGTHQCQGVVPLRGGHAHHTLGRDVTGDDPSHIVAACAPCNQWIGSPTKYPDPSVERVTRW